MWHRNGEFVQERKRKKKKNKNREKRKEKIKWKMEWLANWRKERQGNWLSVGIIIEGQSKARGAWGRIIGEVNKTTKQIFDKISVPISRPQSPYSHSDGLSLCPLPTNIEKTPFASPRFSSQSTLSFSNRSTHVSQVRYTSHSKEERDLPSNAIRGQPSSPRNANDCNQSSC